MCENCQDTGILAYDNELNTYLECSCQYKDQPLLKELDIYFQEEE